MNRELKALDLSRSCNCEQNINVHNKYGKLFFHKPFFCQIAKKRKIN